MRLMGATGPLHGLQVLDVSQGIAGPYCGALLAEQGADVVKVEPRHGDWIRGLGAPIGDLSAYAVAYNRGKRSLCLDLKDARGRDVVLRLAARADVVLESFRPGVAERLGIGHAAVSALNPAAVYLSISGFGQQGPNRERPCTDTVAQAFSGLMSVNPGMDGIPHKINVTIVDAVTGLYAFQAVLLALHARRDDGEGRHLDVSLMQAAAALQAPKIIEYHACGGPAPLLNVPAGSYRTRDGWIAVTLVKEDHFGALCAALEIDDVAADPRFATFPDRARNVDALLPALRERFAALDTADWVERLGRVGVLCNAVHDHGDWLADAHVRAVDAAPMLGLADGSAVPVPRTPGQTPAGRPPPRIGEHSEEILRDLGMQPGEVGALLAAGVIGNGAP